ncbi:MAG: hypothetical protein WBA57_00455 [Elainellaceae cyanobacterium]
MSRNIRLFPSYAQPENQATNHCLVILKMLYEENPKFLSEILDQLIGKEFGPVGVQFIQQPRKKYSTPDGNKYSIPDGAIFQSAFAIFIETKLGDHFKHAQLENHLKVLEQEGGDKILIALGNFEHDPGERSSLIPIEESASKKGIIFRAISFEEFLQAIQLPYLSKNLADAIADLGEFFDENGLLPSWKYRLDVVNCAATFHNIENYKIYTCPVTGGAYQHRRSLYFGAYRNKTVEKISQIAAVVDLESEDLLTEGNTSLIWKNIDRTDNELEKIALDRYKEAGGTHYPTRIFILGDLFPTNFKKTTSGGMFGNKIYFDIEKLQVNSAEELAKKLQDKSWENYESD